MLKKQVTLFGLIFVLILTRILPAWQQTKSENDLPGKPLPIIVSTPATGAWYKKHPFDPAVFGKVRGYAPANQISQLAIFSDGVDITVRKWLKQIDQLIKESNQQECYVTLFDVRGAQIGGYQADELSNRISELQKLSKENQVDRLSIGIAANNSPGNKAKVGLDDARNFSIILLTKANPAEREVIVQSQILLDSKNPNEQEFSAALKLINQHLNTAR